MKEVHIIEKHEFERLSIFIAESIIRHSKKFYGFTMISRDTNKEMVDSEMLGALSMSIWQALKELGDLEK